MNPYNNNSIGIYPQADSYLNNINYNNKSRTPNTYNNKYGQEGYRNSMINDYNQAKTLINDRLSKLSKEKDILNSAKNMYNAYDGDINTLINLRTMAYNKGQLANPNLYSYQFMDPIYYPLEMPISAEPISLPKIEMGHPMNLKNKRDGMGIEDLLALLALLKRRKKEKQSVLIPPIIIKNEGGGGGGYPYPNNFGVRHKVTVPKSIFTYKTGKGKGIKRDWWQLARDFCHIYCFTRSADKYAKFGKVRNNIISQRSKDVSQEILVLKDWIKSLEIPLWEELKVFEDLNLEFKNIDSTTKIRKQSQKIIVLIKKFLENLISKSTKTPDIPERVQQIIYNFIKDKAYFPRKFLTTYQINRLNFHYYGSTKELNEEQRAMMIATLLISEISVLQILLNIKANFVEFRNYPNIELSCKYLASILHYLVKRTFLVHPEMNRETISLLDYYRNYHLYNALLEKQTDIYNKDVNVLDDDEISVFLIPEDQISEFWNINAEAVSMFQNYIYNWAYRLAKGIRQKFRPLDKNLIDKTKHLPVPPDKTATHRYEVYGIEDEEK